jgi:hypothetical protein
MSTAASPRHNHLKQRIPVGKLPVGKKNSHKEEKMNEEKMTESAAVAGRLFAFTIDASTAQVVKLETLDASGARRELSEEEKASLAQTGAEERLEQFVERAFEAGIACVLGEEGPQHRSGEPAEEAELRQLLLTPLIEHSSVRCLMQREALNRAILGTLLQYAIKGVPADAASAPADPSQADRATSAHAN